MKIKALVAGLLVAASFGASAGTITSGTISGSSFADAVIGTIHISGLSDLSGSVFAFDSLTNDQYHLVLTLDTVTFDSATVGSLSDLDASASGFSFHNVAAGDYIVKASGHLGTNGQLHDTAFLGANFAVTAVPEPETYGMLLGGLALVGMVARRKSKKAA